MEQSSSSKPGHVHNLFPIQRKSSQTKKSGCRSPLTQSEDSWSAQSGEKKNLSLSHPNLMRTLVNTSERKKGRSRCCQEKRSQWYWQWLLLCQNMWWMGKQVDTNSSKEAEDALISWNALCRQSGKKHSWRKLPECSEARKSVLLNQWYLYGHWYLWWYPGASVSPYVAVMLSKLAHPC